MMTCTELVTCKVNGTENAWFLKSTRSFWGKVATLASLLPPPSLNYTWFCQVKSLRFAEEWPVKGKDCQLDPQTVSLWKCGEEFLLNKGAFFAPSLQGKGQITSLGYSSQPTAAWRPPSAALASPMHTQAWISGSPAPPAKEISVSSSCTPCMLS